MNGIKQLEKRIEITKWVKDRDWFSETGDKKLNRPSIGYRLKEYSCVSSILQDSIYFLKMPSMLNKMYLYLTKHNWPMNSELRVSIVCFSFIQKKSAETSNSEVKGWGFQTINGVIIADDNIIP